MRRVSKNQGNALKREKHGPNLASFFYSQKFNHYDRYLSVVTVEKHIRSATIMPENTLNVGWKDIATKRKVSLLKEHLLHVREHLLQVKSRVLKELILRGWLKEYGRSMTYR